MIWLARIVFFFPLTMVLSILYTLNILLGQSSKELKEALYQIQAIWDEIYINGEKDETERR